MQNISENEVGTYCGQPKVGRSGLAGSIENAEFDLLNAALQIRGLGESMSRVIITEVREESDNYVVDSDGEIRESK